jgi:predicted trehalose synthase
MSLWKPVAKPPLLETDSSLPAGFFKEERWFADRGVLQELLLEDSLCFYRDTDQTYISFNLFRPVPLSGYFYFIPLLASEHRLSFARDHLFAQNGWYFYDAIPTLEYIQLLEELLVSGGSYRSGKGELRFESYNGFREPEFSLLGRSSNSLLFVKQRYLIKNYRRVYPGINPELLINAALTRVHSDEVPAIFGAIHYQSGTEWTLGMVQEYIVNQGTGWEVWGNLLGGDETGREPKLLKQAFSLGATMAGLHQKMAMLAHQESKILPLQPEDLEQRVAGLLETVRGDLHLLLNEQLGQVITKLQQLQKRLSGVALGSKFRIHGDLHLEQVLKTDTGWKVIDFEGEPLKSIAERENYDSPLKDLASMLRSISYRVRTVTGERELRNEQEAVLVTGLVNGYSETARDLAMEFLPSGANRVDLLMLLQLERVIYECRYESKYRPDWIHIPLDGLFRLLHQI